MSAVNRRKSVTRGLIQKMGSEKQAVDIKRGITRVNQCHTFDWSRTLWAKAANKMAIETSVLLVSYFALVSWLMYFDGLRGIDIPYFLACTLTTVGYGDYSPSSQSIRLAAVFFLPFGLVIVSFGISNVEAFASAQVSVVANKVETSVGKNPGSNAPATPKVSGRLIVAWTEAKKTTAMQFLYLLRHYTVVILAGALFFYFNWVEQRLQKQGRGGEMTFVDALYLATVTATTVGYGHALWPASEGAKLFMVLYFFVATGVVGSAIGNIAELYLGSKREEINQKLLDSTIWVHKADLHHTGVLYQSDFVLFKLQQMMAVDSDILNRLSVHFEKLDADGSRFLRIGEEVPSAEIVEDMHAEMVKNMQEKRDTTGKLWMEIWKLRHVDLVAKFTKKSKAGLLESALEERKKEGKKTIDSEKLIEIWKRRRANLVAKSTKKSKSDEPIKINECHNFAWSRKLWRSAAEQAGRLIFKLLVAYTFLGYFTMAYFDASIADRNWLAVDGWYFFSATITTVGLGDFAPETQLGRGFAVVMIPAGLVVLSLVLAGLSMYSKAYGDGVLARQEVLDKASKQHPVDSLDIDSNGICDMSDFMSKQNSNKSSVFVRCVMMLLKLYGTIFMGALFFKLNSKFGGESQFLTWIDCFYWGTVVSTSIGYGDITPSTFAGKVFLIFYMLVSTVIVSQVLCDFISLYVNDVVSECINSQIVESTIWVHKMDISGPSNKARHGKLSEADYILFKLIQMQKVDDEVVDRLIDVFFELDTGGSGSLVLGVDVPNSVQVAEMKVMTEGTGMTLQEAWHKHNTKAYRLRAEVHPPGKENLLDVSDEEEETDIAKSSADDDAKSPQDAEDSESEGEYSNNDSEDVEKGGTSRLETTSYAVDNEEKVDVGAGTDIRSRARSRDMGIGLEMPPVLDTFSSSSRFVSTPPSPTTVNTGTTI